MNLLNESQGKSAKSLTENNIFGKQHVTAEF